MLKWILLLILAISPSLEFFDRSHCALWVEVSGSRGHFSSIDKIVLTRPPSELANDPDLKDQEWDRFLPKFKKRSVQSRKLKKQKAKRKSKFDSVFPPEQMPRKEDLLMESGEYFWSQEQREETRRTERRKTQIEKSVAKKREKNATLHPKTENLEPAAKRRRKVEKE